MGARLEPVGGRSAGDQIPAKLIVMPPDGPPLDHDLRPFNTIGRHPDQNVQILDRVVSKEHALVTYADAAYWLQDMGSRNGTFVNGTRITGRTRLKDGDTVTMGATQIRFVSGNKTMASGLGADQVTINANSFTQTAIRSRLEAASEADRKFLPAHQVTNDQALRNDYEKLRISFELNQAIGTELKAEPLLQKILDKAFEFTTADRGVILLMNEDSVPEPAAAKFRSSGALSQFEVSQTILNEVITHRHAVLSSDASIDSRFGGSQSIMMQGIRSTMCVPLVFGENLLGMIHLDSQIATGVFTEKDLQVLSVFAQQAAMQLSNARLAQRAEHEAIARDNLSRLLSPNLVEEVVAGRIDMDIGKGGELHDATVVYTDIRGFTAMSEKLAPRAVVSMLNEYFEIMVDIIFQYEGTLDKFVGDAIMAIWGAPVAQDDHAERAVRAVLDMMKALERFNRFREANRDYPLPTGVGINTGEVVAGYVGSSRTMSYTVIGDTVNTAARLCSHAGPGEVLISDPVKKRLEGKLTLEDRPAASLKGKAKPVPIYRVLSIK